MKLSAVQRSLLASGLVLVTACTVSPPQITTASDPAGDDDAAPAGDDTAAPGDDAGATGEPTIEGGTAPVDTQTDPHDCGAVGHDCGGAACSAGLCAPVTVRSEAGPFAVAGATMFQLGPGHTLLSGATTPNATTTTIATLDPVCATGTKRVFTTPSYVFVDCSTKLQVVSRSTHVVTTIVLATSPQTAPWGAITANDSLMFYFDGDHRGRARAPHGEQRLRPDRDGRELGLRHARRVSGRRRVARPPLTPPSGIFLAWQERQRRRAALSGSRSRRASPSRAASIPPTATCLPR